MGSHSEGILAISANCNYGWMLNGTLNKDQELWLSWVVLYLVTEAESTWFKVHLGFSHSPVSAQPLLPHPQLIPQSLHRWHSSPTGVFGVSHACHGHFHLRAFELVVCPIWNALVRICAWMAFSHRSGHSSEASLTRHPKGVPQAFPFPPPCLIFFRAHISTIFWFVHSFPDFLPRRM